MDKIQNLIQSNPTVSMWITIISLFSAIITVIAFIKQLIDQRRKIIGYYKDTTQLIGKDVSSINSLRIEFHNQAVETVSVSTIKIFNSGNCCILPSDFYNLRPLIIATAENIQILDYEIRKMSDNICEIHSKLINNTISFDFECIESKEGFEVVIYHTGNNNNDITVDCKIKDGKLINKTIELIVYDGGLKIYNGHRTIMLKTNSMLANMILSLFSNDSVHRK